MGEEKKNGKTTFWGVVSAVGVLCMGAAAMMDGDPETVVDTQAITAAIGAILAAFGITLGGKASKDAD